ncbi:hypothetical protein KEM55_003987, partial [Ascosphaera atra]
SQLRTRANQTSNVSGEEQVNPVVKLTKRIVIMQPESFFARVAAAAALTTTTTTTTRPVAAVLPPSGRVCSHARSRDLPSCARPFPAAASFRSGLLGPGPCSQVGPAPSVSQVVKWEVEVLTSIKLEQLRQMEPFDL